MLQLGIIFQDHMMLQRNHENKIYGKDLPGEEVRILFQNQVYHTSANPQGEWSVGITPVLTGGPFSMLLTGSSQIEIKDIMIGDLYFLSGQSNMEMKLTETIDVTNLDSLQEFPKMRFLSVTPRYLFEEENETRNETLPNVTWKQATRGNFSDLSGIGYFFARELMQSQNIPVGLIQTAVGGSFIEAWMKKESLNSLGNPCQEVAEFNMPGALETKIQKQVEQKELWANAFRKEPVPSINQWGKWYFPQIIEPSLNDPYYGSIWLKKEFFLDDEVAEDGSLRMGLIIDEATIWINDHYVGRGLHRYEMLNFKVCKEILKQGKNEILIHVVIENGAGGLVPQKPYGLTLKEQYIDLSGIWEMCKGETQTKKAPDVLFPPLLPQGLFYGVLRPLRKLQFRAVLWYQGESNVGHLEDYKELFDQMKADWEEEFQRPLHFCCVLLANYQDPLNQGKDTGWAKIRDDQRRCRKEEQSDEGMIGLINAIDLGERNDLHPHNKKEVAHRLALWVSCYIYGEKICCHGPVLCGYKRMKDRIFLYFMYDDSKEASLHHFEMQIEELPWTPVTAIHKEGVVEIPLSNLTSIKKSEAESQPIRLRYAWYDDPGPLNFYNSARLPAESFFVEIK